SSRAPISEKRMISLAGIQLRAPLARTGALHKKYLVSAHRSCERIGIERIPLLASPQGGVAEQSIKCREAAADREAGVVFRLRTRKENHPGCVSFGGFATFS